MSFQIQITVDSIAEAERILACLRHDNPPAAQQVAASLDGVVTNGDPSKFTAGSTAEPKKRGRPRKEESAAPAATESAAQSAPAEAETALEVATSAQQTPPTLEDVKSAIQELLLRHHGDMAPALEILGRFGARSASFVNESDRPAFIAECKTA